MRGRRERGLRQDAPHGRMRALARRAAGAVGHRDEIRRKRREPRDRLPEILLHLLGLGRKELERDADRPAITPPPARRWRSGCADRGRARATPRSCRRSRARARGSGACVTSRPAARHPLRHGLGRKAEAAMRVLLAQEFQIVRREIDHQQPAARRQHARRLADRARAVVEEVQHLMDDHDVERARRHREIVDVALAHAAMAQARALDARAREQQHVERQIDAEPALDARRRTIRACGRCRCRDRAASGTAARRARRGSRASTASSVTCSLRMRSHCAACARK